MTGSRLHLLALAVLSVLLSQTQLLHSSVEIGSISEVRGNAQVLRDKAYGAELQFDIQQMDDVRTEAGRVAITFEDSIQFTAGHRGKKVLRFIGFSSGNRRVIDTLITFSTTNGCVAIAGYIFFSTSDDSILGAGCVLPAAANKGLIAACGIINSTRHRSLVAERLVKRSAADDRRHS